MIDKFNPKGRPADKILQRTLIVIQTQLENLGSIDQSLGEDALLQSAYYGDVSTVKSMLDHGVPLDTVDKGTGMTALHLAVGGNHLDLARLLVERGASFMPDKQGRMQTTIAAECEVSGELCDFIAQAEARAGGV
jgi:ankyrin repeat protein